MITKNVHLIISVTDYYLQNIDRMLKSVHNLLSDDSKYKYNYIITLITNEDNELLEEKIEVFNKILNDYNKYKIEKIDIKFCPNFPWPVMTLYKPWLCSKYINKDYDDYVWCGNCNLEFEKNDKTTWFDENKINVSWHHKHPGPYYNERPYYIQGGFIFGSVQNMKLLCDKWQSIINYYINKEHKVPDWHDETVLNEIFNANKDLFNTHFIFYCETELDNRMPGSFCKIIISNKKDNTFKFNY